jgi:hypothetical protein
MNQLALPLEAMTAALAEEEIIFGQGIRYLDYWAGTVVRPVAGAPQTTFVWMELHKGNWVIERRLSADSKYFMAACWNVAPADQWTKA